MMGRSAWPGKFLLLVENPKLSTDFACSQIAGSVKIGHQTRLIAGYVACVHGACVIEHRFREFGNVKAGGVIGNCEDL